MKKLDVWRIIGWSVAGTLAVLSIALMDKETFDNTAIYATSTPAAVNNAKVVGTPVVDSAIVVGVNGGTDGKATLVIAMSKEDAVKIAIAREEGKVYAYLLPFGQGGQDVTKDVNLKK